MNASDVWTTIFIIWVSLWLGLAPIIWCEDHFRDYSNAERAILAITLGIWGPVYCLWWLIVKAPPATLSLILKLLARLRTRLDDPSGE